VQKEASDERSVRIAIRSDCRMFHDTLATCLRLRPDLAVVGHVTSGQDLLDLCRLRRPEIVVFDAGADIATSAGLLAELRSRHGEVLLIVIYEHLTTSGIAIAARLDIDALVPHSHGLNALQATVQRHAEVVRSHAPEPTAPEEGLTEQERQIIAALSAGHTADRVAELLGISRCAVENSKRRIYQKMRVSNQSHAIARAIALGLMDSRTVSRPRQPPPGAALRVALYARDALIRHRLATTLLDCHIPFVVSADGSTRPTVAWNGHAVEPAVAVLADPEPEQWEAVDDIDVPVLLVRSGPMSRADVVAAIGRGVAGMIDADRLEQNLVPALTLTAAGHLTVSWAMADGLVAEIRARMGEPDAVRPVLTPRERDILRSIASGDTVRQTARTLGIAQKTVENIQARLFRKLGVRNRAGAVASAHSLGLLEREGEPEPDEPG
jgi:two-component system, NarL family, nitrate/nitrite response regulator NarL